MSRNHIYEWDSDERSCSDPPWVTDRKSKRCIINENTSLNRKRNLVQPDENKNLWPNSYKTPQHIDNSLIPNKLSSTSPPEAVLHGMGSNNAFFKEETSTFTHEGSTMSTGKTSTTIEKKVDPWDNQQKISKKNAKCPGTNLTKSDELSEYTDNESMLGGIEDAMFHGIANNYMEWCETEPASYSDEIEELNSNIINDQVYKKLMYS